MNCLCCWMILSHRCLCCSKRCTTKFFCRMTLSLSSACDCISAFSISSSWTLQRRPRTSRCSSELTRRGSSSSRRCAWSRSSRNLRSSNALRMSGKKYSHWVHDLLPLEPSTPFVYYFVYVTLPTFCLWIFFCSAMSVTRFSRAIATSWVSVLSGGDSGESESFSLSSLLTLSFLLSARHFLLRLLRSCSQLRDKQHKPCFATVVLISVFCPPTGTQEETGIKPKHWLCNG